MDTPLDGATNQVGATLEYEMSLVREAIVLVAGGGSRRVVVAGLRFGETLLATLPGFAAEAGVRLVPLWMPDDAGADVAVERIGDD